MDKLNLVKTEADALLKKMIDVYELEVSEDGEVVHIVVKTDEDAPTIIGRHGETIRALQKLLEVIMYKQLGQPVNVLVNVNDYREKQKERLEGLAMQLADKARATKEPVSFRGLSSYERKLIHEYITANHTDLTTYSEGEGRDRRLVIDIKKE